MQKQVKLSSWQSRFLKISQRLKFGCVSNHLDQELSEMFIFLGISQTLNFQISPVLTALQNFLRSPPYF